MRSGVCTGSGPSPSWRWMPGSLRSVASGRPTLMLTVRDAIPKARELATAEFATLRLRLLKIAARVVETTSRIRLAFAAACPEADLFCSLPGALLPLGPYPPGPAPAHPPH